MSAFQIALLIALAAALLTAATTDLRARIIPNRLNAAVALLAIGWWFATGLSWTEIGVQIGIAAVTFAIFAGIFALGWMGGGDVKLIGALALWLPALPLARMLVLMVLGGGLLSLAILIHHRLRKNEGTPEVPYGVAIAVAALFVLTNDLLTITAA
jgi:prepilin peptidase CpaA